MNRPSPIKIKPDDLIDMASFATTHPIRIDVVYAKPAHKDNLFGEKIYKPDARLWLHKDLAAIVATASKLCFERTGLFFSLKDGLRTTDAQALMLETAVVKRNPHWLEEPRLLSPPGAGGHPRGMAIDIVLEDQDGHEIDMGTKFDYLTEDQDNNPAARDYRDFSPEILENRLILEHAMVDAAANLGMHVWPLPQEWWDFRFKPEHYEGYAPLSDDDLPDDMRLCS